MDNSMGFPQFRKLANNKHFYRIESAEKFDEIQIMGRRCLKTTVVAKIYPEKLLIMDMLGCVDGRWLTIEESEYNSFLQNCASLEHGHSN